jgi:anti-sigma regulatory factor (Ser/Thr protein kinase)
VEHAYSPAPAQFELTAVKDGDEVTIVVADAGHWRPPRGHNRGRGLTIIEAAMDGLEVTSTDQGTRIHMRKRT